MTNNPKNSNQADANKILVSLPQEELKKITPISEEDIVRALQQGRKERDAVEANTHPVHTNSRILFR